MCFYVFKSHANHSAGEVWWVWLHLHRSKVSDHDTTVQSNFTTQKLRRAWDWNRSMLFLQGVLQRAEVVTQQHSVSPRLQPVHWQKHSRCMWVMHLFFTWHAWIGCDVSLPYCLHCVSIIIPLTCTMSTRSICWVLQYFVHRYKSLCVCVWVCTCMMCFTVSHHGIFPLRYHDGQHLKVTTWLWSLD